MTSLTSRLQSFVPNLGLFLFFLLVTIGTFAGGTWAAVGIIGSVLLFVSVWTIDRQLPIPDRCLSILALFTLSVMALTNLHSSHPDISWFEWRRLVGVFIPLLLLSAPRVAEHAHHPRLFPIIIAAAAISSALLGLELGLGGPVIKWLKGPRAELFEYNRGLSYLILLTFPMLAWMWVTHRRRLILPFLIILIIPSSLTESRAAKLALILGVGTTMVAWFWPLWVQRGLGALSVLMMGWPFVAQQFFVNHQNLLSRFPASWHARMEIWDYLSYRIMEHPLLGWGLGTSHTLDYLQPHGAQYVFITEQPASHPHNVVTQLWVELGLPGLALGLIFAFLTLHKIGRLPLNLAPYALGAWMAAFCLSLVAYNFWTDSLFSAFAMTSFAFALLKRQQK